MRVSLASLALLAFYTGFCNLACAATFRVGDTSTDNCDFDTIQQAVDAAALTGGQNYIHLANSGSYGGQALSIGDQSLLIEGGYARCDSAQPSAQTDIAGDATNPVLRIQPSGSAIYDVSLIRLHLFGGGTSGVFGTLGGGVYVSGNVKLYIATTRIDGNASLDGGGIFVDTIGGTPSVQLDPGTWISGNHATYFGGGIALNGGGNLYVFADDVHIDGNRADDAGGGIFANSAMLFVGNTTNFSARDDASGATIEANVAGSVGGGIYLYGPLARLSANELIVAGNSAGLRGGGIAAEAGAHVSMQRDYGVLLPLQCPNWRECSRISDNTVGSATGAFGGGIALSGDARADIAQTILRGNVAQDGSAAYVDASSLYLEGVLVSANHAYDTPARASTAIRVRNGPRHSALRIAYSTFADNLESPANGAAPRPSTDVLADQDALMWLYSSALYDSYYPLVAYSQYADDCLIEGNSQPDSLGSHTRLRTQRFGAFNDAAQGDYRLRTNSPLNDACDASVAPPAFRDLLLQPRCHDDPRKPDEYGTCDVGAYESDHIFGDGLQ